MIERFSIHFAPGMDERMISVYLPQGYGQSDERYPVMYMFDGQNAFDEDTASYGCAWQLHEFMERWEKNVIIVGMQSSAERDRRLAEYCPFHLAPRLWDGLRGRGRATMEWIAGTLKPHIDAVYRTMPDRLCTGVMGASMGALMSLYAVTVFNGVFSKAACISPALSMCYPQMLRQIQEGMVDPDTRVYMSFGECEVKHKKALAHETAQMLTICNHLMRYGARTYPYLQEEGRHCEADWREQTAEFMRFLWLE